MQDSQQNKPGASPSGTSRRNFFAGAATVGAAAAATVALPRIDVAPVTEAARPAPERGGGYTLSEHVKRYYKTTRL
ncbi:twin-arginine translocation signal domain-containing protein [Variovorax sp. VNK109]|uniref:twin-arginine translocation signal domain-containing protein n=1 Tax=Variovorax sp. VNK109 TaxID=3400919 RepID=UPI003C0C64AC